MRLQEILAEALTRARRTEDAQAVLTTTEPWLLTRFGIMAIENAPQALRFETAHRIKLALDDPANGGPGFAKNYELRKHVHPFQPDRFVYRAYDDKGRDAG